MQGKKFMLCLKISDAYHIFENLDPLSPHWDCAFSYCWNWLSHSITVLFIYVFCDAMLTSWNRWWKTIFDLPHSASMSQYLPVPYLMCLLDEQRNVPQTAGTCVAQLFEDMLQAYGRVLYRARKVTSPHGLWSSALPYATCTILILRKSISRKGRTMEFAYNSTINY